MPRKLSKFHELSDRSKRRRANEAGCSNLSYSVSSSDIEITAVTPSPDKIIPIHPLISNDPLNINSDSSNDNFHNIRFNELGNAYDDFIISSYNSSSISDISGDESIHEPCIKKDEESDSSTGIKHFLKHWAIKHNVTDVCLSDLLVGLKSNVDGLSELPSDARTLLKNNIVFEKSVVEPGSYIHFGLEIQLKRLISTIPVNNIHDLKLLLNIDGLPLFKSSANQVYPILIAIMNISQLKKKVFPVGIYYGMQKPNNIFDFLNPFINELVDLITRGIINEQGNKISVKLIGICCDAPAKKDLLGIKGHGGYNSCTKCTVHGVTVERRRIFTDLNCPMRTNDDFINWVDADYRQSDTPLLRIPDFDFVKSIILDFMHLVCLGVMRTMLLTWCNGELPHKLSRQLIQRISNFLNNNHRSLPVEFVRQPRDLKYLLRYKATEYRSFLLYLGPVALKGVLSDEKYDNFLALHVAISILLNPTSCQKSELIEYARLLLRNFVQNFINLYDEVFITHNFHGLIHLPNDVEYFGTILDSITLDTISAFPFENYLQTIKKMIRGKNKPLEQIGKRLAQIFSIGLAFPTTSTFDFQEAFPKLKNAHSNGPLPLFCNGPQYSTLLFFNFTIKILPPNNCCGTKKGDIIMIENICYSTEFSNCCVIVGRKFLDKRDFFKKPCESSSIGIYEVQKLSVLKCWPITEIITKMWILIYLIDEGEKVPDVIPNVWKIDQSSCWYPKSFKSNIINSLARKQSMPDHNTDDWECCTIQIIESDITDYQIGLKMMVKLAKNVQNLHSDVEQRGRGKRTKWVSSKRLFDNLDSDEGSLDGNFEVLKSSQKKSKTDSVPFTVSFPSIIKDNTSETHMNCTPVRETSSSNQNVSNYETLNSMISNQTCTSSQMSISNVFKCKLAKKSHSCTFENNCNDKETLLLSMAHQLCKLSAENKKITSNIFYMKQELNSFIENTKLNNYDNHEPTSSCTATENVLAPFPLKNEDELILIESKLLSADLSFTNKLVTSFVFASEGKSVQKVTTNMLKTIFSYELASEYSWKGQKNKKKLHTLSIFKVIIDAVSKKFPNEVDLKCSIIDSIKTWFARAPYQIEALKKQNKKPDEVINKLTPTKNIIIQD